MNRILEVEAVINAIMMATHPAQYAASVKVQASLKAQYTAPRFIEAFNHWPSVASGFSWITNRITAPHRDGKGFKSGFDYLSVTGTNNAVLRLEDLGAQISYKAGTVVAIAGAVLTHEVQQWGGDPRTCIARWIRRKVFEENDVKTLPWAMVDRIVKSFCS
jgi:hypothetical protein